MERPKMKNTFMKDVLKMKDAVVIKGDNDYYPVDYIRCWDRSGKTEAKVITNEIEVDERIVVRYNRCDNCGIPKTAGNSQFFSFIDGSIVCEHCTIAYLVDKKYVKYNTKEVFKSYSQIYSDRVTPYMREDTLVKYFKALSNASNEQIIEQTRADGEVYLVDNSVLVHEIDNNDIDGVKDFAKLVDYVLSKYNVIGCLSPIQKIDMAEISEVKKSLLVWYPLFKDVEKGRIFSLKEFPASFIKDIDRNMETEIILLEKSV